MRKVKLAYLHSGLSIPGISNEIGATLNPTDPTSKIRGAELGWEDDGLWIGIKGRSVFVPSTNVKSVEFLPDEAKKPAVKLA